MTDTHAAAQRTSDPVNRFVLLGASNLTLSLRLIIGILQERCGRPSEILVAAGHGRSYGRYSQVLARGLPGIVECDLWPRLENAARIPSYAFVTDLGNDIPYGHSPEALLEWVSRCVEWLRRADAQIVMTNIPLGLVESLSEMHFRIVRGIFFPFSHLPRSELIDRARIVHRGLVEIAGGSGLRLIELKPEWLGPDIIHVLYWKRKLAYRELLARFTFPPAPPPEPGAWCPGAPGWVRQPRFARQRLFGRLRTSPQPSGLLDDGSIVYYY